MTAENATSSAPSGSVVGCFNEAAADDRGKPDSAAAAPAAARALQ